MRRTVGVLAAGLLLALALVGCGSGDGSPAEADTSAASSDTSSARSDISTPKSDTSSANPDTSAANPDTSRVRARGIDASHHQGAIDWAAVAGDGIAFAYLKASEGTSYTDPTFAGHRTEAQRQGIRVGGYHYFQLCSSGVEQAAHFVSVLGSVGGPEDLPPAVDLELAGSCAAPPARAVLLDEVRAFLQQVEAATGRRPVVYLYPELEERYGVAGELGDYRQWVRSLDGPPDREWWIWQQTDSGSVDGIAGPVDVNLMWR